MVDPEAMSLGYFAGIRAEVILVRRQSEMSTVLVRRIDFVSVSAKGATQEAHLFLSAAFCRLPPRKIG